MDQKLDTAKLEHSDQSCSEEVNISLIAWVSLSKVQTGTLATYHIPRPYVQALLDMDEEALEL